MADPVTLSMMATVAGTAISAGGALMGGVASSQSNAYKAQIANLNSQIALQNRDYAIGVGETEAEHYGVQARQRIGAIRAGEGASNIDVGSGSKAEVLKSQQLTSDIDLAQIRNNAARKAYGYEVEAVGDTAQGQLDTMAASNAMKSGEISALGSLVSGAGSVASKWYQGTSVGLFDDGSNTNKAIGN